MTGSNISGWLPRAIKGTQIDRRANLGSKSGSLLFSDLKRPIVHRFMQNGKSAILKRRAETLIMNLKHKCQMQYFLLMI